MTFAYFVKTSDDYGDWKKKYITIHCLHPLRYISRVQWINGSYVVKCFKVLTRSDNFGIFLFYLPVWINLPMYKFTLAALTPTVAQWTYSKVQKLENAYM